MEGRYDRHSIRAARWDAYNAMRQAAYDATLEVTDCGECRIRLTNLMMIDANERQLIKVLDKEHKRHSRKEV